MVFALLAGSFRGYIHRYVRVVIFCFCFFDFQGFFQISLNLLVLPLNELPFPVLRSRVSEMVAI
jgi:hypothetical protein